MVIKTSIFRTKYHAFEIAISQGIIRYTVYALYMIATDNLAYIQLRRTRNNNKLKSIKVSLPSNKCPREWLARHFCLKNLDKIATLYSIAVTSWKKNTFLAAVCDQCCLHALDMASVLWSWPSMFTCLWIGAKYCSQRVCMSARISKTSCPNFTEIFCRWSCVRGSILLWDESAKRYVRDAANNSLFTNDAGFRNVELSVPYKCGPKALVLSSFLTSVVLQRPFCIQRWPAMQKCPKEPGELGLLFGMWGP